MRTIIAMSIASLLAVAGACGDDQEYDTDFAGIYEITSWTHNPDGCAAEGPEAEDAARFTHFFLRHEVFLGVHFVQASVCYTLDECRINADIEETLFLPGFRFDVGNDEDGWAGNEYLLVEDGDTCSGQVKENFLEGQIESSIRIQQESRTVDGVPLNSHDACDYDEAGQRATSLPCEELTVFTGGYLEAI